MTEQEWRDLDELRVTRRERHMVRMKTEEQQEMIRDAILGYYQDPINEELLGAFDNLLEDAGKKEGPWKIQETSYGQGFLLIRHKPGTRGKWIFNLQVNGEYHRKEQEKLAAWLAHVFNGKVPTNEAPTAKEIVEDYLRVNGYDGLCDPDAGCGCGLDDLCPCGVEIGGCVPAYLVRKNCADCVARNESLDEVECYTTKRPEEP